jgi:hypothetical protein
MSKKQAKIKVTCAQFEILKSIWGGVKASLQELGIYFFNPLTKAFSIKKLSS